MKQVRPLIRTAAVSLALALPLTAAAAPGHAPHSAVVVGHEVVQVNGASTRHVTTVAVNGRSHIFWGPLVSGVLDAVFHRHHPAPVQAQVYVAATPAVPPPPMPPPPPPLAAEAAADASAPVRPTTTLGLLAGGGLMGSGGGLTLRVDGKHFGLSTAFSGVSVRERYLESSFEGLALFEARLTWSPWSGERGRLRLEAGISSQLTSRVGTLGLDAGVSSELQLLGPLGVEASAFYTAYPHRRFDGRVGATLKLGAFGLQAGLRNLWVQPILTTAELGEAAAFPGPYLGATYTF